MIVVTARVHQSPTEPHEPRETLGPGVPGSRGPEQDFVVTMRVHQSPTELHEPRETLGPGVPGSRGPEHDWGHSASAYEPH